MSIVLSTIEVPIVWILTAIFILGLLWEVSQQLGIMPETADYAGDMVAYLGGAVLGALIGRLSAGAVSEDPNSS